MPLDEQWKYTVGGTGEQPRAHSGEELGYGGLQFDGLPNAAPQVDNNATNNSRRMEDASRLHSLMLARIQGGNTASVPSDLVPGLGSLPARYMTPESINARPQDFNAHQVRSVGGYGAAEENSRSVANMESLGSPEARLLQSSKWGGSSNSAPTVIKGALILSFDGRERLLSKPDSYKDLLDATRKSFQDLENLHDRDIAFRFVPDWIDREVELDSSAFEHIHDRALLKVIAPPSAPAAELLQDGKRPRPEAEQEPPKRLKIELGAAPRVVVDLISDSEEEPPQLSAASLPGYAELVKLEAADKEHSTVEQTANHQQVVENNNRNEKIPCRSCWHMLCVKGTVPQCSRSWDGKTFRGCRACRIYHNCCVWDDVALFEASPALRQAADDMLSETKDNRHITTPARKKVGDVRGCNAKFSRSFSLAVEIFRGVLQPLRQAADREKEAAAREEEAARQKRAREEEAARQKRAREEEAARQKRAREDEEVRKRAYSHFPLRSSASSSSLSSAAESIEVAKR